MNAALTSFALYEAYGTRPYEWGEDPDRQKANTKEEETDLGLLFEGMRIRNLYDGTFMTRDPIGYKDGPNLYCYTHCNPITQFDALGLDTWTFTWTTSNGEVGHSAIAISNYKDGKPDGTATFYSLGPGGGKPANALTANSKLKASYTKMTVDTRVLDKIKYGEDGPTANGIV